MAHHTAISTDMFQASGVDRVLEETVTRHHLWELADLAALAGKTYLHLHACRSAIPCMQRPRLAAMSNHFLFFVRVLRSLEKSRACFSRPQPTRPARRILIHSTQDLSLVGACGSRLITYKTRSTTSQPIRPGNHATTTLRLKLGKARRATEGNLEVIGDSVLSISFSVCNICQR